MMTNDDFRTWMQKRGYNQSQVADILRVSQSQVSRWLSGQSEIPGPVEVVLSIERGMRAFLPDFPGGSDSEQVRDALARCQAVFEMILVDPAIPPRD
jgi:transcriptional regulator with XRE-family HTH domain